MEHPFSFLHSSMIARVMASSEREGRKTMATPELVWPKTMGRLRILNCSHACSRSSGEMSSEEEEEEDNRGQICEKESNQNKQEE